jgi:hypothetical protein
MIVTDTGCDNILIVGNYAHSPHQSVEESAATDALTSGRPLSGGGVRRSKY